MRTSTASSVVAPTFRTFFSWIARNSFTCMASGKSDNDVQQCQNKLSKDQTEKVSAELGALIQSAMGGK